MSDLRTKTNAEILTLRARLRAELAAVDEQVRDRKLSEHRPMCPNSGPGPDGVLRYCGNQIRHTGPCEFIYRAVFAKAYGEGG